MLREYQWKIAEDGAKQIPDPLAREMFPLIVDTSFLYLFVCCDLSEN